MTAPTTPAWAPRSTDRSSLPPVPPASWHADDEWPSPANHAIMRRIAGFADLPDDWDSYGAVAPDAAVIRCARGAVVALDQHKITVRAASVGAGNNIGLEFQYKGVDLLIDLDEEEWQVRLTRDGGDVEYHTLTPSEAKNIDAVLALV